jgi:hypothetical protein
LRSRKRGHLTEERSRGCGTLARSSGRGIPGGWLCRAGDGGLPGGTVACWRGNVGRLRREGCGHTAATGAAAASLPVCGHLAPPDPPTNDRIPQGSQDTRSRCTEKEGDEPDHEMKQMQQSVVRQQAQLDGYPKRQQQGDDGGNELHACPLSWCLFQAQSDSRGQAFPSRCVGSATPKPGRPAYVWTYGGRVLEVTHCAGEQDERASVEIYRAVWPHAAITIDDNRSFKASVPDHVDCQTRINGATVDSGVIQVRRTGKSRSLVNAEVARPADMLTPRGVSIYARSASTQSSPSRSRSRAERLRARRRRHPA